MTQAANDNLEREVAASVRIQAFYRGAKVREGWHRILRAALLLERMLRGYLARLSCKSKGLALRRQQNVVFFHYCASVVQRFFRGWLSRRQLHDFYARKRYLEKVEQRGEYTSEYLQQEHQQKLRDARLQEEQQMRQDFDNLAGELHHLVSTRVIAGVYNPPYSDTLPRAFDKSIEQHLRDSCRVRLPRSLRRPRHLTDLSPSPMKGGSTMGASQTEMRAAIGGETAMPPQELPDRQPYHSRTASVGHLQKVQGPFRSKEQIEVANAKAHNNYGSVQAGASFAVMEHDRKMQARLSKLTRVSPVDFKAPGIPSEKLPPSSVHVHIPYRDKPVEMRGDYTELPKIRDKPPFFTALQRDRQLEDYNERPFLPVGHI